MARRHITMYRVWSAPGADDLIKDQQLVEDCAQIAGFEYGAHNAIAAARLHCSYHCRLEEQWPVTCRVRDLDTNKLYEVEVHRVIRYEYESKSCKEIT